MSDAPYRKFSYNFALVSAIAGLSGLACGKNSTLVEEIVSNESALNSDKLSDKIKSVETVIATPGVKHSLKNKNGSYASLVIVNGYVTPMDGNGGIYCWTNDTTALDDGINVIVPAFLDRTGSWKRVSISTSPTLQANIIDQGDSTIVGSLAWLIKNKIKNSPTTIDLSANTVYAIKTSLIVPSNVRLRFQDGAKIIFTDSSATLKVFGVIEAGLFQIFDTNIPGQVRLQAKDESGQYHVSLTKEVYPQWWGASSEPSADTTQNHDAFEAAIVAFPTKVFIPAGKYVIHGQLSVNTEDQLECPSGMPFEIFGAGKDSTTLMAETGTVGSGPFISVKGNYPSRAWYYGKLHDLALTNTTNIGLLIQTPLVNVYDLYVQVVTNGGIGIDVGPTSMACVFERIDLNGPGSYLTPDEIAAYLDSNPTPLSMGLRTRGGNNGYVRLTSTRVVSFDVGINLYSTLGGVIGWTINNTEIGNTRVGIALNNSPGNNYNSVDILETFIEMAYVDHARGIRFSPAAPMHACRVIGGRIDSKGSNPRPIVVNGYLNVIDVSYGGTTYGSQHPTTQLRFGDLAGPE